MFQAMLMAIFVTLGWQLWGRDWSLGDASVLPLPGKQQEGPIASLPPSVWCPAAWQVPTIGVPSIMTWYTVDLLWALPLLILINVNLSATRSARTLGPAAPSAPDACVWAPSGRSESIKPRR